MLRPYNQAWTRPYVKAARADKGVTDLRSATSPSRPWHAYLEEAKHV